MQDVPSAVLQPTEVIPAKRFLSAKKSVICDVRMEEFTLKKLTALFLALLMLVSMCACAAPASTEDAYQAKVALCLVTPVNDGAWSQLAYDAVMKAKDTYNISVKYTENIKPTEMEAVFTDYASQGYDLIIGHSFSFGDAALAVRHRGRDDALAEPRKGDVRELFVDDDADPNGGPLFGLFRGVDGQGRGQRAAADGQNETSGEQGDPAVTEYHGILHWRERR